MIAFWAFVIVFFSLSFSDIVFLDCLAIVPIALFHCLMASDDEIGFAGLRNVVIFSFMSIGVVAWSVEAYG